MANASTIGFGLRMVMNVGNTPATSGQSEYQMQNAPGVATNKGDPVSIQDAGGSQGHLQDASFTVTDDGGNGGTAWTTANSALLAGVFNGAFFIDASGKPTFANNIVAGQTTSIDYNTGSNGITCLVNDNPFQEYVIKADAAVTQAMQASQTENFNTNNYTATDNKNGQSITTLDIGSTAATSMFKIVRSANDPENKDLTVPGANVVVITAQQSGLYS
jgi:hypothetical protein|tara:strand:- start:67 stop:720 length:654 start_codon:yes stop_codon:yes gene_type:complete